MILSNVLTPVLSPVLKGTIHGESTDWEPTKPVDSYLPDLWMRPDTGVATAGSRSFIAGNKTHLQIADNVSLSLGDFSVSYSLFVYVDSLATAQLLLSKGSAELYFAVDTSGRIQFGNTTGFRQTSAGSIVIGRWHHIVGIHDVSLVGSARYRVFINGVENVGTFDGSYVAPTDTSTAFNVGRRDNGVSYFGGRMSRLGFWKKALTQSEITFLTNSGEGRLAGELGIAGTDGAALRDSAGGSLPSYWNLNEGNGAGNAIDSIGTNDLVPTFAELLSNTGFETAGAGGADVFANWVEAVSGSGTSTINDETVGMDAGAHACRFDIDASNSFAQITQTILTVGSAYSVSVRSKGSETLNDGFKALLGTTEAINIGVANPVTTSYQTFTGSGIAAGSGDFTISRDSSASKSVYFDTVSVKATQIPPAAGPMESIAQDSIGTNDGVLTNMDSIGAWSSDVPPGMTGYSLKFDGTDDYVIASGAALAITGSMTACAWIKYVALTAGTGGSSANSVIGHGVVGETEDTNVLFNLSIDSDKKLFYLHEHGAGTNATALSTIVAPISAGVWHHIGFARDNTAKTITFFVDGVQLGDAVSYATNPTGGSSGKLVIGNIGTLAVGFAFNGRIDDSRLYNVALTAPQVAELASGNEATGATPVAHYTFDDGPQSQIISDGDPIVTTESKEGNRYQFHQITGSKRPIYVANGINGQPGIQFDGIDDLLVCASAILAGTAGTAVIVYRLTAVPSSYQSLISSADEGTSNRYISLDGRGSTANAHLNYSQDNAGTQDLLDGNTVVANATDYVAIFSSDGTTIKAWLNGVAQTLNADSGANNGDWWDDTTLKDNVVIGGLKRNSESQFLSGIICDILVYPVELTEAGRAKVASYVETRYGIAAP